MANRCRYTLPRSSDENAKAPRKLTPYGAQTRTWKVLMLAVCYRLAKT
jgi:hypothetical protein